MSWPSGSFKTGTLKASILQGDDNSEIGLLSDHTLKVTDGSTLSVENNSTLKFSGNEVTSAMQGWITSAVADNAGNAVAFVLKEADGTVTGLADPVNDSDAATKGWVDNQLSTDLQGYLKHDGTVAMSGNLNMDSNRITSLSDPVSDQDAATKGYIDSVAQGLQVQQSVRAGSTGNIDLSSALVNAAEFDGVTLATNDRFLVKDQTDAKENGIYIVAASGAAARADDMNADGEFAGRFFFIEEGTVNGDNGYVCTSDSVTMDTDNIAFTQFSGAGHITAGLALTKTGNTLHVAVDDATIQVVTDALQIKAAGVGASHLAANAVTSVKILDDAVTSGKILDEAVTSDKIKNGDVTTTKIADAGVTNDKLAADAVETDNILDANVTNAKLASGIDATKLRLSTGKLLFGDAEAAIEVGILAAGDVASVALNGTNLDFTLNATQTAIQNITPASSLTLGPSAGELIMTSSANITMDPTGDVKMTLSADEALHINGGFSNSSETGAIYFGAATAAAPADGDIRIVCVHDSTYGNYLMIQRAGDNDGTVSWSNGDVMGHFQ